VFARSLLLLRRSTGACVSAQRCASSKAATLPALPYAYDALEPYVSASIMQIHHQKHHAAYVANFNKALESLDAAQSAGDVAALVGLQAALTFNGGGHVNHALFWQNLAPAKDAGAPAGELLAALVRDFGSLDAFKSKFAAAGAAVQGSGWVWLVLDKATARLAITTRANQDPVSTVAAHVPLLGVDVWEHAYYLQYKNVRPDYLAAIWNVINWKVVADRLAHAQK
jgi:superoxide dismutase, Fe-Mn family